ncbi:hypothetical protein [Streptomyces paromomycinus]|uniref:Uncharacterized protein n=1 Tax=Streptomyces paromomycinus TaxID=92743 RepID=A0A401VUG9_STREY|nr:hypothetical protein [Streptomyces paromomycinus]GCD40713.1 hypothetical protein GKJPGBOP_00366 [Streptomyces paromomycinus]
MVLYGAGLAWLADGVVFAEADGVAQHVEAVTPYGAYGRPAIDAADVTRTTDRHVALRVRLRYPVD